MSRRSDRLAEQVVIEQEQAIDPCDESEPDALTALCIVCNEREADPAWGDYCSGVCYIDTLNDE